MKKKRVVLSTFVAALLLAGLIVPASGSVSPQELVAVLAAGESVTETKVVFVPPNPPMADVVFAFDCTGTMRSIIDTAKARTADIMTALGSIPGVDVQYGVMSYMDYPQTYASCGYWWPYGFATFGDYAYSLDQAVTSDISGVGSAIDALVIGSGADNPQDYTRIFYESYADPNVGWRTGARHILVNFGDSVPHDCDLNEGVPGRAGTWSTGGDPGRDGIMGTEDDLDLQTVLAEMAANGVVLLEAHTTNDKSDYWDYWTGITGGDRFLTGSDALVSDIVAAVTAALGAPTVHGLHLEASTGYESWLYSVSPESCDVDPGETGATVSFDVTIRVPDGTLPGIYSFTIRALDGVGVNYGDQAVTIVVYDATAGFVTGGGWIDSPAGAYTPDPSLTGKANFGFVSRCTKGADIPTGNTEFQFHAADLNFRSDSYEWLLVSGSDYARFKGVGTINGEGPYKFMLWAGDGEADTFRIRIWEEDEATAVETVIYDNGFGQPIADGSIVIHTQ